MKCERTSVPPERDISGVFQHTPPLLTRITDLETDVDGSAAEGDDAVLKGIYDISV